MYMTMGIKNYICLLLSYFCSCICDGILDHLKPALIYLWFPRYHLFFSTVFSVLVNYFYRTRAHGLLVWWFCLLFVKIPLTSSDHSETMMLL